MGLSMTNIHRSVDFYQARFIVIILEAKVIENHCFLVRFYKFYLNGLTFLCNHAYKNYFMCIFCNYAL